MIKNSELAECGSYLQTKILQLLGSKIPNRIFHFSSVVITRNSNKRVVHQTKDEDDVEWSGTCGICGLSQDFRITFAKHAELHSCFLSPGKHLTWPFFFFFSKLYTNRSALLLFLYLRKFVMRSGYCSIHMNLQNLVLLKYLVNLRVIILG